MFRLSIAVLLSAAIWFVAGCGGKGSSSPAPTTTPTTGGGGTTTPVNAPVIVTVGTGQSVTGIDVNVSPTASATPPNAQLLGVNALTGTGSASNVGGTIHQGSTMRIVVFGPGLDGSLTVTIGGPADITVSNVISIKATDGTPGLAFDAAVAANAALGARTVFMRNASNEITTFTGGLEVIP